MAKTYKHLYQEVVSFSNLYLAYREAARGKRGHPEVAAFDFDLEANLLRLQDELGAQTGGPRACRPPRPAVGRRPTRGAGGLPHARQPEASGLKKALDVPADQPRRGMKCHGYGAATP